MHSTSMAGSLVVMADEREREKGKLDRGAVSVMPGWSIWAGALVLLVVGALALWVLFSNFGDATARDEARVRIVYLAGSITLWVGGVASLLLGGRRQRSTELGLRHTEQDLEIKLRAAEDARHDASKRRLDELYSTAAGQLDSDKALVRTTAMQTLERLGEANPDHRQAVVNLLCAYLRMPFNHPDDDTAPPDDLEERRRELQVRHTAQRFLVAHLKPKRDLNDKPTDAKFWPDMSIDLSHAVLDRFDISHGEVAAANFDYTSFFGVSDFSHAIFRERALINHAIFHDDAWFSNADFHGADFNYVRFCGLVDFEDAVFDDTAEFRNSIFHGEVGFRDTVFLNGWELDGARHRWDSDQTCDSWPDGWSTCPPKDDEEGRVTGLDGVWGFVVESLPSIPARQELAASIVTVPFKSSVSGWRLVPPGEKCQIGRACST